MALMAADNFYRGLGRTDVPMWFGFAKLGVNCGFNYVFIFGALGAPALGTDGAAVGTVIANLTIGAAMLALLFLKAEFREPWGLVRHRGFDRRAFRDLVVLSLPIGLQTFMEMGGISAFTAIVGRLGEAQLAATNAAIQAWSIAFMAGFSLSVGATTLVGQCVGARDLGGAREAVRRVLRIGYVMMGLLAVLYLGAPEWLMGLFVEPGAQEALRPFARPVFAIVSFCLFLDLNFMIAGGALRGAGDTTFSMFVNIGSSWLVLVPATALMAPRFGLVGAWSCLILHLALMGLLLRWRWAGTAWQRPPREEDEPPTPGDRPEPLLPEAA
jgi:MATE family multidrug resistance protein